MRKRVQKVASKSFPLQSSFLPPAGFCAAGDGDVKRRSERSRCGHVDQELMGAEPVHTGEGGRGPLRLQGPGESRGQSSWESCSRGPRRSWPSQAPWALLQGQGAPVGGESPARREGLAEDPPTRTSGRQFPRACVWLCWLRLPGSEGPSGGAQVGVAATHAPLRPETQSGWLCPRNQDGNRAIRAPPSGFPS